MCGLPSSSFSLGPVSAEKIHPVLLLLSAGFRVAGSARAVQILQLSSTVSMTLCIRLPGFEVQC